MAVRIGDAVDLLHAALLQVDHHGEHHLGQIRVLIVGVEGKVGGHGIDFSVGGEADSTHIVDRSVEALHLRRLVVDHKVGVEIRLSLANAQQTAGKARFVAEAAHAVDVNVALGIHENRMRVDGACGKAQFVLRVADLFHHFVGLRVHNGHVGLLRSRHPLRVKLVETHEKEPVAFHHGGRSYAHVLLCQGVHIDFGSFGHRCGVESPNLSRVLERNVGLCVAHLAHIGCTGAGRQRECAAHLQRAVGFIDIVAHLRLVVAHIVGQHKDVAALHHWRSAETGGHRLRVVVVSRQPVDELHVANAACPVGVDHRGGDERRTLLSGGSGLRFVVVAGALSQQQEAGRCAKQHFLEHRDEVLSGNWKQ